MEKTILESVDETENRYRRYIVALGRSLFGEHTVIRARGRIGQGMRTEVRNFRDYLKAKNHHDRILETKKRRGYKIAN